MLQLKTIKIGPGLKLFAGVVLSYLVIFWVGQLFYTKELLFNTYESAEFVEKIVQQQKKYGWLSYVLLPVVYAIKFLLIAIALNIGVLFFDKKIAFKKLWNAVLWSEFVFIAFLIIQMGLLYYYNFQTLDEMRNFNPFSLVSYVDMTGIPEFLHYPVAIVSVDEICYWLLLTWLMMPLLKSNFVQSLGFVAGTYGSALFVWITLVIFLSLNL